MSEEQQVIHSQSPGQHSPPRTHHTEHQNHDNHQPQPQPFTETHTQEPPHREVPLSPENDASHHNSHNQSPNKQTISSPQQSPDTKTAAHGHSQSNSTNERKDKAKISCIPGLVLDELTEFAMAQEGIDIEDLVPVSFEDLLRECNGNQKLAQIRYEYKESERLNLLQDIENRKKYIQYELATEHNSFKPMMMSPDGRVSNHNFFSNTQQPSFNKTKLSKTSQSHANLSLPPQQNFSSLKAISGGQFSKKNIDNKIFENMIHNQAEQEQKLRRIQERQELFLMKSYQMQEKRQREILKKQEMIHQKQVLKEEKLKTQEEIQKKWQMDTITKMKIKTDITEQRQMKFKQDFKYRMQEKEMKKQIKMQHAQEQFNQYLESMYEKQKEVEVKNYEFHQKLEVKARKQKEIIIQKKIKKEQVLHSVQEQRDIEEQKKMDKFMQAQFFEMEKERRIEEEKKKQHEQRQKQGKEKSERLLTKVEETYTKMAEWQQELERREKIAAENLKKQQQILSEKIQIKKEMKRLKQESAQLKQKRKENKQKLKNDEMLEKLYLMYDKVEKFKMNKEVTRTKKQQEIFKAEQKRADMKTAFYHMAVWNVNEAGEIIKEILEENDKANLVGVKPKSVAEKVREKAARIRRDERLGLSRISPKGNEHNLHFISEEDHQELEYMNTNGYGNHNNGQQQQQQHDFERAHSNEHQEIKPQGHFGPSNHETQKVVFDSRQQH